MNPVSFIGEQLMLLVRTVNACVPCRLNLTLMMILKAVRPLGLAMVALMALPLLELTKAPKAAPPIMMSSAG